MLGNPGIAALLAWFSLAVFAQLFANPPAYASDGTYLTVESPLTRGLLLAVVPILALGVFFSTGRIFRSLSALSSQRHFLAISACVLLIFLLSIFKGSASSVGYAALLMLSLALSTELLSSSRVVQRQFFFSIVCISWLFCGLAFALYGPPNGRWVGGVHPNIFGFIAVIAGIGGFVLWRRVGWLAFLIAIGITISISSRYAIAVLLCGFVYVVYARSKVVGRGSWILPLAIVGVISLFYLWPFIESVFLLNDASRGLGSGASGRTDLNANFMSQMSPHLLDGFGFRRREVYYNTHNGYLNFMLEVGVVASGLLIYLLISSLFRYERQTIVVKNREMELDDVALLRFLLFFSSCLSAMFQPQLVNFGDAQGCLFIMLILGGLFALPSSSLVAPRPPGVVRNAT